MVEPRVAPLEPPRPDWVIPQTLRAEAFVCCGGQDPFPLQCVGCHRPLVICLECDSLFEDLSDPVIRQFASDSNLACPGCGQAIDWSTLYSEGHRISFADWQAAGLDRLLTERSIDELAAMLARSAEHLGDMLRRGMRSSTKTRFPPYRNFAESIEAHIPDATCYRHYGQQWFESMPLRDAVQNCDELATAIQQAYAILGAGDVLFPR